MNTEIKESFNRAHAAKYLYMNKVITEAELDYWFGIYEKEQHKRSQEIAKKYNKKLQGGINRVAFMRGSGYFDGSIVDAINLLYPTVEYDTERKMIAEVRIIVNNRGKSMSNETIELINEIRLKREKKEQKLLDKEPTLF